MNSPSGNQVLASPLSTTTYVATVTSDSGCVIQDSVIVNVQGVAASISVSPQDPRVCAGNSVTLTASINTPAVPYTIVQGAYSPYPTTGGTNVTGLLDDNFLGPIPIGFVFPFFANNSICVSKSCYWLWSCFQIVLADYRNLYSKFDIK